MSGIEHVPTSAAPRTRQPSCDLCRRRKVKCTKATIGTQCEGCVAINQECKYKDGRRKPGPRSRYTRAPSATTPYARPPMIEESTSPRQLPRVSQDHGSSPSSISSMMPPQPSVVSNHSHTPFPSINDTSLHPQAQASPGDPASRDALYVPPAAQQIPASAPPASSVVPPFARASDMSLGALAVEGQRHDANSTIDWSAIDWSWLPVSTDPPFQPPASEPSAMFERSGWSWDHNMTESPVARMHASTSDGAHISGVPVDIDQVPNRGPADRRAGRFPSPSTSLPSISQELAPPKGIEEWISWSTLMRILHAYHTYLYPLLPVMHWPTFLQLLMSREDERSQTWRAYLLSLVAYAIIQLPRSTLSFLEVLTLRQLHRRCHSASTALQNRTYRVVTTTDIATLYCDHIYLGTLGRTTAANVALSKAIRLAQELKMHDEGSVNMNADRIELEVRRRLFWLLYGSDRTISALTSAPLQIFDPDVNVALPSAIDDNLITSSGAFPQPPDVCSVLSGFHHVSRIFLLLGSVLTALRSLSADKSSTRSSLSILPPVWTTSRPASQFQNALNQILADLPRPLQFINPLDDSPTAHKEGERDQLRQSSDNFEICKANLLVSQAMVRLAIRQYAAAVGEREDELDDASWVEQHALSMLETMLSKSLAANGESLRNKVLYVASNLLEKYHGVTEGNTYVSGLLTIYAKTREEQQAATLESAESAMPSRAPTPGRV